jgi:hypothetical protein
LTDIIIDKTPRFRTGFREIAAVHGGVPSSLPPTRPWVIIFDQQTAQPLAKNAFASLPLGDVQVDRFCASDGWLGDFMAGQHFSFRMLHPERWTPIDLDEVEYFLEELEKPKLKSPTEEWKLHALRSDYDAKGILHFKCYFKSNSQLDKFVLLTWEISRKSEITLLREYSQGR